jgi:hypothetical protein
MLRFFRFSSGSQRVAGARGDVRRPGKPTRPLLEEARAELAGVPLSGSVALRTAPQLGRRPHRSPFWPQAASVPCSPSASGKEHFARMSSLRVGGAPRVLKGSSLVVDLQVRQTGYRGTKVTVFVEDAGRSSLADVELPADGQSDGAGALHCGRSRAARLPVRIPTQSR